MKNGKQELQYKLIVADFDDTVMSEDLEISETLPETVARYEAAGGRFRIATGRMTSSILSYARKLGFRGEVLSFQGSVVTDIGTGATIKTFAIPNESAIEVARYIESKGYYFHTYKTDKIVTEKTNLYSKIYQSFCDCGCVELGYPVSEWLKGSGFAPVKFVAMEDPEKVPGIIEDLNGRFGDKVLVNTSKEWLVEIISKGISKGKAVAWLAERLGAKREETICIGDSLNDATMLEWAGLSFCVENGSPAGKAAAKAVCPACDKKGVEWVIRKYGLGEEI